MTLRNLISYISLCFHFAFFQLNVFGSCKLKIDAGVWLWKSKIDIKGKNNNIVIGKNVNLKKTSIVVKGSNNKIRISDSVKIYESCEILIEGDDCNIFIGKKTTLGSASIFCGESNTSIHIGDNCMLSRERSEERRVGKECRSRWSTED